MTDPLAPIDREWVRRRGLREFVRRTWPRVDTAPLQWGWHLDAMCEHLEAVTRGEIRRLVINVPPGSSKTTLTSILWPAWEWTLDPTRKLITASYDKTLVQRDARKARTLVTSDWFRERWPDVEIPQDRTASTAVSAYYTSAGGFRYSTTVRSPVTGHHAHKHLIDDPIDPKGAALASGAEIEEVLRWYTETMSTRFCDPATGAVVLIMQRLHPRDLAAEMIRRGAEVLCLPMRFERQHPHRWVRDPRTTEGELLNPARFPEPVVKELEGILGPYGTASQLQQRPAPAGGHVFRKEWMRQFWVSLPPGGQWTITVDCAFKDTDGSSLVAFQAWYRVGPNHYLVDRWTERRDFDRTCRDFVTFCERWPKAHGKLVEAKANGPAVMNTLKRIVPGLVPVEPEGGKESRAHACVPLWSGGNVFLPHPERAEYPDGRRGAPWLRGGVADLSLDAAEGSYEHTMLSFPKGATNDDVDATSQYLNHAAPSYAARLRAAFAAGA